MSIPSSESRPEEVSEADWSEQQLDAGVADDLSGEAGLPDAPGGPSAGHPEVDEADLVEQETIAYPADADDDR